MQTFWIETEDTQMDKGEETDSVDSSDDVSMYGDDESEYEHGDEFEKLGLKEMGLDADDFDERTQSLVRYNAEVLLRILKQIVARRMAVRARNKETGTEIEDNNDPVLWPKSGLSPMEEVQEIIHLPEYDSFIAKHEPDPDSIEIDYEVVAQLNDFVRIIASMYRSNPFHNFEHASHVAMSVSKLLSRIVAPTNLGLGNLDESIHSSNKRTKDSVKSTLHDHTYGITSDPLTQFACVLSALFHDADHPGVPNAQLVKERTYIARQYDNKSVAEQNSVDACWDLLMDVNFRALRKTICVTEDEQRRFRHLVVNSVMATDIVDKELKALRNARWETAFSKNPGQESERDRVNRKATIVIEHLIQASDIAHTMQHWHIYRKWNERLYQELLIAYRKGRSETDPSDGWYKGELGFFDFYIIPLSKKLKDCGVFGVSCDEYLNYATQNRANWERKGKEIVAAMIEKYRDDAEKPKAQLDSVQDSEGGALRSSLISSDTAHGNSSHSIRALQEKLDLDTEAMSAGSKASFSMSAAMSLDGDRSFVSSTETIPEDSAEWDSEGMEDVEKDDFYSTSHDESDSMDDNDVVSPRNKSREASTNSTTKIESGTSRSLEQVVANNSSAWGEDSGDSFFYDEEPSGDSQRDLSGKGPDTAVPPAARKGIPTKVKTSGTQTNKSDAKPSKAPSKPLPTDRGKSSRKARSAESHCSTTQGSSTTEWEQDTVNTPFVGQEDTIDTMEIYCLQQRINNRLVGSIKNTRAYDRKPSEDEMIFF